MLCAISGEVPQVPVASRKSGNIFEKRLIESYISEHGSDPVNGEELSTDDLVELKNARAVRPRPPTLTSIPALLSTFQNEWDALALESYTLKQQLLQTRQELSTTLYDLEGAFRVIAKLTQERDEARDALSKVTVQGGSADSNGDSMQVDGQELPEAVIARIDATAQELQATRRKRAVPADWATGETITAFETSELGQAALPSSRALAVDESGDLALFEGSDSSVLVYSISEKGVVHTLEFGKGHITDAVWWGARPIISTSTGAIKIFEKEKEIASFAVHAGSATGLALHPTGDLLASVGSDKSYVVYDLESMSHVTRVFTDSELTCGQFHPDGALFAAGGKDGEVKVYNVKAGDAAAQFSTEGPLLSLSFSENGIWFAAACENSTSVDIFDLRKPKAVKTLDLGSAVTAVQWDYTGQFLAIAGAGGVAVEEYSKKSKKWTEPFKKAIPATALAWGALGSSIALLNGEGALTLLK
ncbi:hypothetical protein EG328_012002 [Venturia inaequalis]|uniref:Pre-mRNA-processing factor 19 n=1 Tax=Venturia inaequalis TaxID=5025 RepID=A0A8H3V2C9_VENIN|nr:hypothetical protein EG328_012002 [Venturia inaequalis]